MLIQSLLLLNLNKPLLSVLTVNSEMVAKFRFLNHVHLSELFTFQVHWNHQKTIAFLRCLDDFRGNKN